MRSNKSISSFLAVFLLVSILFSADHSYAEAPARQIYQLIIYHIKDKAQEERIDKYLSTAYLAAVHRLGVKSVGVFKTAGMDTAANKKIYVLLAYQSLNEFHKISQLISTDKELAAKGTDYLDAAFNNPAYIRKESILMEAFSGMPLLKKPTLESPKSKRIYELRSYESATEKLHLNKVRMFNKEEMEIFERIGSQPVFYAEVLAGSRMPNLMYMTAYSDKASRDDHWKTFGNDPKWKRVSALPEYQHNTDTAVIELIIPVAYADF